MDAAQKGQPLLGALPTTIEMALQPSNESRVITEPVEPFRIVHVNDVWCHVCGFDAEEVLGQTCKVLQGPGCCEATLTMLKQALNFKRNFAVQLLNYTKQGRPFMNTLQVTPLVDRDGKVTHYLGVVIARYLDGNGCASPSPSIQLHSESSHALVQREADAVRTREARGGGRAMQSVDERGCDPLSFGQSGMGLAHQSSGMLTGIDSLDSMRDEDSASGRVPPFLTKLCEILTVESSDVVTFNPEASSFRINNPTTFAKEVLPRYFKHNKLGSFSQQLHTYGFRRKANASSLDASVEFFHDQYTAAPADFLTWIRAGGAVSKRAASTREVGTAPPPGLINDMHELDDGIRQLGQMFQQARAIHAVQLRTVISKLTVRGLLSPDSASYISSLPPATPMLSAAHLQQVAAGVAPAAVAQSMLGGSAFGGSGGVALGGGTLGSSGLSGGSFSNSASVGSASAGFYAMQEQTLAQLDGSGSGFGRFSMGSQSMEGLQAQWDALDAGIAPLNGRPLSTNGSESGDSMQLQVVTPSAAQ